MPAPIDLTGHTYSRLTVLRESTPATYPRKWECRCECGNTKTILGASLRGGLTQSCGCLNKERLSETHTVHGGHGTRLHSIWHNMKQRCQNENRDTFSYYGALGITICDEWTEFAPFQQWALASGYSEDLTLDRKDSSKGYSPNNCRWADRTTQARNQKIRSTNSSGYVGVSYLQRLDKYQAYLTLHYKKINLGYFTTAEEAANARKSYITSHQLKEFATI